MSQDIREKYGADTRDCDPWPYSFQTYAMRVLWLIVWLTIWKLCWKRFSRLRCLLLRLFGAKTGAHAHIAGSAWVEMPWNLTLGDYVTIGARSKVYNLGPIVVGDHAVISQDVDLCGGTHDFNDPTYPLIREKIEIGEYAWVAAGAFVLPGVSVGDGAVVAARAVATKDVEPWTIVGGNPAQKIGERKMRPHEKKGGAAVGPDAEQLP